MGDSEILNLHYLREKLFFLQDKYNLLSFN